MWRPGDGERDLLVAVLMLLLLLWRSLPVRALDAIAAVAVPGDGGGDDERAERRFCAQSAHQWLDRRTAHYAHAGRACVLPRGWRG